MHAHMVLDYSQRVHVPLFRPTNHPNSLKHKVIIAISHSSQIFFTKSVSVTLSNKRNEFNAAVLNQISNSDKLKLPSQIRISLKYIITPLMLSERGNKVATFPCRKRQDIINFLERFVCFFSALEECLKSNFLVESFTY